MMLAPLRPKTQDRNKVSSTKTLPSPTKGWYVGENIANAPEGTAYLLQNAFPRLDYVRVRRGSAAWATGMPNAAVSTIMPYANAAVSKMFAVCNGGIYDVSNTGAVGAAGVSGLANSFLLFVQFQGLGGSYLIAVNGADAVQVFDGANWNKTYSITGNVTSTSQNVISVSSTTGLVQGQTITGAGIPAGTTISSVGVGSLVISQPATATATGVALTVFQSAPITTPTNAIFSNVSVFRNRLYFVERNSLNIWYLPVNSIGGTATLFPTQGVFTRGGYIIACGNWAIDSTSGIYESFVALSSEGEVVMYDGSDPSSWTLKGTYRVAKPLGPRCFVKAGGDLLLVTQDGIVPMSKVQTLDQIALQNVAVTKPIAPVWHDAVKARTGLVGWQVSLWPAEDMGIVNLPKANAGDRSQFVVNARTGAWASYLGWDANCFAVYNDNLFYGSSDGRVMQGEVGAADDGVNYTATIFPSFNSMNDSASRKQAIMVRPFIQTSIPFSPQITIKTDYDITLPNAPSAIAPVTTGALWDSARWDIDVWPAILSNQNSWITASNYGATISPVIQATLSSASSTPDIRFMQIDVLYEGGNLIA